MRLPKGIGVAQIRVLGQTVVVVSDRLSDDEKRVGRVVAALRGQEHDVVLVPEIEISLLLDRAS